MSADELYLYFEPKEKFARLKEKIEEFRDVNNDEAVETLILDASKLFAIPESIYVEQITRKFNEQLFMRAFKDYPSSIDLNIINIDISQDKNNAMEKALTNLGTFTPKIWDKCREILPDKSDEIWQQQLSMQILDREDTITIYQMEHPEITDDFAPTQQMQEIIKALTPHGFDFTNISTAFALLDKSPTKENFEWCITYHPFEPNLWFKYLSQFEIDQSISDRSIRFCLRSGIIWAKRTKFDKNFNFEVIKNLITDVLDWKLFISTICSQDKDFIPNYIEEFKKLDCYMNNTEVYVTASLILDEYYIAKHDNEKRRKLLSEMTERASQRSDIWLRRIDFLRSLMNNNPEMKDIQREVGETFANAIQTLQTDKSRIQDAWLAFKAGNGEEISDAFDRIMEIEIEKTISMNGDEKSEQFNEKTIFVSNIKEGTKREDLKEFFSEFGDIKRVTLKTRFAYVEYENAESADNALKNYQRKPFNNGPIEVSPCKPNTKYTLYIRYDAQAKDDVLIKFIKEKSGVQKVKYRLANASKEDSMHTHIDRKGYGFLDVEDYQDFWKILGLNGTLFNGKALKIEKAKQNRKEAHDMKKTKINKEPLPHQGKPREAPKKNFFTQSKEEQKLKDDKFKDMFGF